MRRMRWETLEGPAIPTLIEALRKESKVAWNRNLDRGDFTNPSQLDSIYGLAAIGKPAVPALTEVLGDDRTLVDACGGCCRVGVYG